MTTYFVEQGMTSPRDNKMGWRFWGDYADLDEARKVAKKLAYGRVTKVEVIAEYRQSGSRAMSPGTTISEGSPKLDEPLRSRHEAALAIALAIAWRALQRADRICNSMPVPIRPVECVKATGDIVREALHKMEALLPPEKEP